MYTQRYRFGKTPVPQELGSFDCKLHADTRKAWCQTHGASTPSAMAACNLIPDASVPVIQNTQVLDVLNEQGKRHMPADPPQYAVSDQGVGGIPASRMTNAQYARMSGTIVEEQEPSPAQQQVQQETGSQKGAVPVLTQLLARSSQALGPALLPREYTVYQDTNVRDWKVLDQGVCGSCWAFATIDVFSYMVAKARSRASGRPHGVQLYSVQQMFSCTSGSQVLVGGTNARGETVSFPAPNRKPGVPGPRAYHSRPLDTNNGCEGGYLPQAVNWLLANTGTVPSSQTIEERVMGRIESQPQTRRGIECSAGTVPVAPIPEVSGITLSGEEAIKRHIVSVGPVAGAMQTQSQTNRLFNAACMSYKGGIFYLTENQYDHAIVVVGWGEVDGSKYWIIKNSWGVSWGYNPNQIDGLANYPNTRGFMRLAINALDLRFAYGMCAGTPQGNPTEANRVARDQYAQGSCLPRPLRRDLNVASCCSPGATTCPDSTACHPLYRRCMPLHTPLTITPQIYQTVCGMQQGRCEGQSDNYVCTRCVEFASALLGVTQPPVVCQLRRSSPSLT